MVSPSKYFSSGEDTPVDLFASRPCYNAGDSALSWVKQLGRNVVTPAYVLRRLALSADAEVRVAVADHLNTPQEVLLFLAADDSPDVRYAIAENHNISRDVLTMLCADSNPYVGFRAAQTLSRLEDADVLSVRNAALAAAS
jgi:hypothetical protein